MEDSGQDLGSLSVKVQRKAWHSEIQAGCDIEKLITPKGEMNVGNIILAFDYT